MQVSKKRFLVSIATFVLMSVLFGVVLPFLMSAKSTIAVCIAIVIIFVLLVGVVYYVVFSKKVKK